MGKQRVKGLGMERKAMTTDNRTNEKKVISIGALILEAMADDDSLMPMRHENGVSIDTRNKVEGKKTSVEGFWTAPDTGERYYIAANVIIEPTEFSYCPEDEDW